MLPVSLKESWISEVNPCTKLIYRGCFWITGDSWLTTNHFTHDSHPFLKVKVCKLFHSTGYGPVDAVSFRCLSFIMSHRKPEACRQLGSVLPGESALCNESLNSAWLRGSPYAARDSPLVPGELRLRGGTEGIPMSLPLTHDSACAQLGETMSGQEQLACTWHLLRRVRRRNQRARAKAGFMLVLASCHCSSCHCGLLLPQKCNTVCLAHRDVCKQHVDTTAFPHYYALTCIYYIYII